MYTHYTTTKNKQQFNSIWLNLQHTHIALCCKGTWVTYMKKEVLLVKKKNYYSLISSYNLHCTSVCQTESKSWQENKNWADFLCPNSHQISWSLINNVFGIKLRLHKKTIFDHCKAITTLYTRVCLLQKPYYCQSSHTARSCNPQQNTRPIYFSWIIWLLKQQRSGSVRSCTVQSDIHVWIRKVITSWCPAAAIVAMISLVVDIIWIHKQWYWTQSSAGFNCVLSDPLTKQYEGPVFLTLCWCKP